MKLAGKLARKFKQLFTSDLPASDQLVQKLRQEMELNSRQGRAGSYAPNYYFIRLPASEYANYGQDIEKKIKSIIETEVEQHNFKLYNDLQVESRAESQQLSVKAQFKISGDQGQIRKSESETETKETGTKVYTNQSDSETTEVTKTTIQMDSPTSQIGYLSFNGNQFDLEAVETNIGRQDSNELTLLDKTVSRVHAQIIDKKYYYLLRDLDSTNGVLVNGEFVQEHQLVDGDRIRLGETELVFGVRSD